MTAIPEVEVTIANLVEWQELQAQLKVLKAKEMALRLRIYGHFFKDPHEGTNNHSLPAGYVLKAKRIVSREIDLGALQALSAEGGLFHLNKINPNLLVEWKPNLNIKPYKALSQESRNIFDQALVIKDGAPGLEIVLPAAARAAQDAQ